MSSSDHIEHSGAFRIEGAILKAVESIGHCAAAAALQVDESYISKLKGSDQKITFSSISVLLDACGLQVASATARLVDEDEYQALITLAEIGFKGLKERGK